MLAGVELGGTQCVCLIGTGPDDIRAQLTLPTGSDPEATLAHIDRILGGWETQYGPLEGLGIASFGPVDLAPKSPRYGHIVSTTKPGWSHTDVLGRLTRNRRIRVGFNTDVNAAALAERRWGDARDLDDLAYITVGTGVGVGLIVGGRTIFGCNHTELGHLRPVRAAGDSWPGSCVFHGDCVEGLASGPAIAARAGIPAADVPSDDPLWDLVAHALGQLLQAIVLATAPRRILIGGGVLNARPGLLVRLRSQLQASLNGYVGAAEVGGEIDRYVVAPGLGRLAGPPRSPGASGRSLRRRYPRPRSAQGTPARPAYAGRCPPTGLPSTDTRIRLPPFWPFLSGWMTISILSPALSELRFQP